MQEMLKQQITIKDRSEIEIDAVSDICAFDPEAVVLNTSAGKVIIEGEELRIDNLEKATGKIHIKGKINVVAYPSGNRKSRGWFK